MMSPKKWAFLTKHFPDRTQHKVKNRFFNLMSKNLEMSSMKILNFLNKNNIIEMTKNVLEDLEFENQILLTETGKIIDESSILGESFDFAVDCLCGKDSV